MQPVLAVLAGFAVVAALLAWSRWLAGRRWAAAAHLLLAVPLGLAVAAGWPLAQYLQSFGSRVPERPVAEVFFERIGPSRFRVAVTHLPSGRMQVLDLAGDEWRLDLQMLDWADAATRLGAQPRSRVEAISSRPAVVAPGRPPAATARLVSGDDPPPWVAGSSVIRGRPLLTAWPLNGPWLPMAHRARFDVRVNPANGIDVDPLNAPASDALTAR